MTRSRRVLGISDSEHQAFCGRLPDFDFGDYVFICDYLPHVGGDGMEHRNSTVITAVTVRTRFPGRTLDDLMRAVLRRHDRVEKPYTSDDLRTVLGEVSGRPEFADRFFAQHVTGAEPIDYAPLLAPAGLLLRPARPERAWLGVPALVLADGGVSLGGPTLRGSPAYEAGLERGDCLLSFDGVAVAAIKDVDAALAKRKPGDEVMLEYRQRGREEKRPVRLAADPEWEIVTYERAGREVTAEMLAFRESWLGRKSTEDFPTLRKHCPECRRSYPFPDRYCPNDGKALGLVP